MKANEVIKIRRNEMGMTQKDLAERVGVTEATVSRWESGDRIARTCDKANDIIIRKLQKAEMDWVNPKEVQ